MPYPEIVRRPSEIVNSIPPNLWEWFASTASVSDLVTALGLGTLAILFSSDRIITKGQHERRVADLQKHHERELTEKDAAHERERVAWASRNEDLKETMEGYKVATREERARADRATEALTRVADALNVNAHVLQAIEQFGNESGPA